MPRLLLVEDERDFAINLCNSLRANHFTVDLAGDGEEAISYLDTYEYDVIILDWMLPKASGIDVLKQYRDTGKTTPVLMLTGRNTLIDKIAGLDSGSDDYLTKPFDLPELLARLRSLLRRGQEDSRPSTIQVGDLELDGTSFQVRRRGIAIKLLPKEFAVLQFLMTHPGVAFTGDVIAFKVWGEEADTKSSTVAIHVARIRKKLHIPGAPDLIKSFPGSGYILEKANPDAQVSEDSKEETLPDAPSSK